MGCVSSAAHVGRSQVLGIIPTTLAEGNFVEKTVDGIGTLEEIFQIASWAQLNIRHKPIGLLNVDGFFNKLLSFLDKVWEENFIPYSARQIFISASIAEELIDKLEAFVYKLDPVAAQ
ncbi:hypothetical protein DITRI_Ditri13aG0098600 [Diplodiscus trichospermus]